MAKQKNNKIMKLLKLLPNKQDMKFYTIVIMMFVSLNMFSQTPPDDPLSPQEWITKMGLGHWFIFTTSQQDNNITTDYSEEILDSLQINFCINGGRLHWVVDGMYDSNDELIQSDIDEIEEIIDDFMERDMAICLNIQFLKNEDIIDSISARDRSKMLNAWAKVCNQFKDKSHNLAMCPVIEFHGWQNLGNPARQDSLNVLYHELTTIFRQTNPTRIISYKPWGSARRAEFQTLDFPFGDDPLPGSGTPVYYVASFSGSAGLGDWETWQPDMPQEDLNLLHFQTVNAGSSDSTKVWGIRSALAFRESTGIPFWMDHWRPNYHKHNGTPEQWTMDQNIAYSKFFMDTIKAIGSSGAFFQTRTFWDESANDFIRLNSNSTNLDTMSVMFMDLLKERCVNNPSGIPDNQKKSSLYIYPNPFTNKIMIDQIINKDEISVFNLLGQDMSDYISVINNGQKTEILTTDLPNGMYIIKTKTFANRIHKSLGNN